MAVRAGSIIAGARLSPGTGIFSVNGQLGPSVVLDAADVLAVATDGSSTMTGSLDLGGNSILNVNDIAAATVNGSTIDATALAAVLGFRDAQPFTYGPPSPPVPFGGAPVDLVTFNFNLAAAGTYATGLAFLVTGTAQGTELQVDLVVNGLNLSGPWLETGIAGGRFIFGATRVQPFSAGANTIIARGVVTGGPGSGSLIAASILVERKS